MKMQSYWAFGIVYPDKIYWYWNGCYHSCSNLKPNNLGNFCPFFNTQVQNTLSFYTLHDNITSVSLFQNLGNLKTIILKCWSLCNKNCCLLDSSFLGRFIRFTQQSKCHNLLRVPLRYFYLISSVVYFHVISIHVNLLPGIVKHRT